MYKKIILITYIFFHTSISYAYLDPVTTGIIYQILFFLFAGFITFFTKIGKLFKFLNKDYKFSIDLLVVICLFPFWILLSDLNFKEFLISIPIFFIFPLIFFYLIKILFHSHQKIIFLTISIIIVYGLDHAFGFTSLINLLRIVDDLTRYTGYLLLFILFVSLVYFAYSLNKRIVNFFIIVIIFTNLYNLVSNEKNINNIKKNEFKENETTLVQLNQNQNEASPALILILDEFSGFGALDNKIKNTKKTKELSEKFFKKFNFRHYPNAYSIYATTVDSIPSYLNFYYKYNYDKLKKFREPYEDSFIFYEKITNNDLFDLYNPNNIYVYQNLTLDFCAYENFKVCKTINPFSKNYKFIDNFEFNIFETIFSKYSFQSSITSILLTRTLRFFDLIKILEPRLIGKATFNHVLDDLIEQSKNMKYSLIIAHIMAPHKPFTWDKDNCGYKFYQNVNFLSKERRQEIHNIEIQCTIKYLDSFLSKLKKIGLLNHYNIIITSDHGARNLNYDDVNQDWHSTFYIERKTNSIYNKDNKVTNVQSLFYNFFHEENLENINNKYHDLFEKTYKLKK